MNQRKSPTQQLHQSKLPLSGRIVMFFVRHIQQAFASMGEVWRNPISSLMTMAVLGVSLSLPAALQVLVKNAEVVTHSWDNAAQISLFIKATRNERAIESFITRVKAYPEVSDVGYISRKKALDEFQRLSGFGDALAYLDENPLPAVVTVTPNLSHASPNRAKDLLTKLQQEPEVSFGRLDIEWLERLQALVNVFKSGVMAIALLLVGAVVLVIGNTIRLAIMNRRSEIEIMKLVGATDAFIQRPFLYTGIWYGVIAGVIAGVIVNLLVWYLDSSMLELLDLYDTTGSLQSLSGHEMLLLIFFASFLGWLGSYISVKQHLRRIEPS
ncbi:cell division protein FtsX [Shewanella sp. OPT22]|nr:cell division protein FtsX [Shewanella sp. OPT22]